MSIIPIEVIKVGNIYNTFKKIWIREGKYIAVSLVLGFVIALSFAIISSYRYSEKIQSDIAKKVVRFHVLANSNSPYDIDLKYKVRDAVIEYTKNFKDYKDREEFIGILSENIDNIKNIADNTLAMNNSNYKTKVFLSNDIFPYKEYGSVSFPAGEYLGLRIEIGEGKGDNWWCVMFPSMCFTDESCQSVEDEGLENLKDTLDFEEYSIITSRDSENVTPKMKFKVVEMWQERKYSSDDFVTNSDK